VIALSKERPRRVNFVMLPEFIPLCPDHQCDMVSYRRGRVVVYYHCPKPDCRCTDKVARKLFVAVTQVGTPKPL
jgi:hypothetical protein